MTQDHPDTHTAWQQAKEIKRGSMQALEDKAIKAYHDAIDEGKSRAESEKQYFETFNKSYDSSRSKKKCHR
jgi:hypothetical protein